LLFLQRALELLALPPDGTPRLLLDIGCGSGLSGEALTEAGHSWLGLDISAAMLDVAVEREVRRLNLGYLYRMTVHRSI
jgi:18S rRNA (guanine1575-N7)-methyltransferase